MTREEMVTEVRQWRHDAAGSLRRYAARHAPNVAPSFVDALERALGDISLDEAIAALDLEQQAAGRR